MNVTTTGIVLSSLEVVYPGSNYISGTTSSLGTHAVDRFLLTNKQIIFDDKYVGSLGTLKLDNLRVDITLGVNGCVTHVEPNVNYRGLNYSVGQYVSIEGSTDEAIARILYTS